MKQIKKLSLAKAISKLTRNEMRYMMAGSGSSGTDCATFATTHTNLKEEMDHDRYGYCYTSE